MKAWSVIGLLFGAAMFATIPMELVPSFQKVLLPDRIPLPLPAPGVEAAAQALDIQSPPVVQSGPVAPVDIQPRPVIGA